MSRTRRSKVTTRWWRKESTDGRRKSRRQYRARCKKLLRGGRYDEMPIYKGTQGWDTW